MKNTKGFHTTQYDLNEKMEYIIGEGTPSFHTTQYDLNSKPDSNRSNNGSEFPYYIVRFKRRVFLFRSQKAARFHTTQYDLNKIFSCIFFSSFEFPYYIVRFKLPSASAFSLRASCFHTTQYDLNRWCADDDDILHHGFHTTQYDLNPVSFFPKNIKFKQFPYYIVRFKRYKVCARIKYISGFHTTQYDLNLFLWFLHVFNFSCFHTTQYDLNPMLH